MSGVSASNQQRNGGSGARAGSGLLISLHATAGSMLTVPNENGLVARGLGYIRVTRLIHRDEKPENVLITVEGEVKVLKGPVLCSCCSGCCCFTGVGVGGGGGGGGGG